MSIGNTNGVMPVLKCGPGRTKASFAKRCDINDIIRRYRKTGQLDQVSKSAPVFADLTGVGDFRAMVHKSRLATEAFEKLPSSVRKRFANDPASLVEFMQDPENRDEAEKLGLIVVADKGREIPAVAVVEPRAPVVPPKEVSKPE